MKLIIFGPPGAGKGTQADSISKRYNIEHISTGEIFRDAADKRTKFGIEAKEKYWSKGKLVPDNITIKIVEEKLRSVKNYIFDGFPRTLKQAKELNKLSKPEIVISLTVPDDVLKIRLLKRAGFEGRSDDSLDIIENRIIIYNKQTKPLLEFYKKENILISIDGNRSIEFISKDIFKILDKFE